MFGYRPTGWVRTGSGTNNVSSTTTFTSRLANNATLVYEFATFDADAALTLGKQHRHPYRLRVTLRIEGPLTTNTRHTLNSPATNYTFSITPAFLKFTLRLDSWNWSSRFAALPRVT